jgi:hypothetical protein
MAVFLFHQSGFYRWALWCCLAREGYIQEARGTGGDTKKFRAAWAGQWNGIISSMRPVHETTNNEIFLNIRCKWLVSAKI